MKNIKKKIIGMVHVPALPGTPQNKLSIDKIITHSLKEAMQLIDLGFDSIILENMHDVPYVNRRVGPEIVSSMTAVACAVRSKVSKPMGIQILAGANKEAIAVAHCACLDFIRAEGFVFAHVADEGFINSDAAELLRYRKQIGAEKVKIFADIKKKHSSHAITADVSLSDTVHAAEFFLADGIIITGTATGRPVRTEDLQELKESNHLPCYVGSGVTPENLEKIFNLADGFIVGSYIKNDGNWNQPLDKKRIERLITEFNRLKN